MRKLFSWKTKPMKGNKPLMNKEAFSPEVLLRGAVQSDCLRCTSKRLRRYLP